MALRKILIMILALSIVACAPAVKTKPKKRATIDERMKTYMDEQLRNPQKKAIVPPPPPPKRKTVMKVNPLKGKLVTINAVNESLSRVLFMIASETGMNLVVSPEIDTSGKVTLTLNNTPADKALEIIMDNSGLFYEIEGSVLKVRGLMTREFKIPYVKTTSEYKSKLGGDIVGGASQDNDSISGAFTLSYNNDKSRNDLYATVASTINDILFPSAKGGGAVKKTGGGDKIGDDAGGGENLMSSGFSKSAKTIEGFFLNVFTGNLTVRTTKAKLDMIQDYIDKTVRDISRQVLIEARMIEIVLDDANSYGIDWYSSLNGGNRFIFNQTFATNNANILSSNSLAPLATIAHFTQQGTGVFMSFLERFGELETLGNPRVRVMNGQSAVISSGSLIPYWEREVDEDADTDEKTISYKRVTVLDGIMLGVTPFISDDGKITMNIVPVSSSVESDKVIYDENNLVVASFPIINLKEAGSIIKVTDGETIIMGGLISTKTQEVENKVPGLGDIPGLGVLFKSKVKIVQKRELVILLKVSIINR